MLHNIQKYLFRNKSCFIFTILKQRKDIITEKIEIKAEERKKRVTLNFKQMERTNRIFTGTKKGKFKLSRIEKVKYTLEEFVLRFSWVFGIGRFTAYEDKKILVKTNMFLCFMTTEIYKKQKTTKILNEK